MSGFLLNLQHQRFQSAASLAALGWAESSLLLLVVATRCCILICRGFLITPSVSPIVRRVMNSVKFEVPSAALVGIQVRVVTLNRLLNVDRRWKDYTSSSFIF